MKAKTLEHLQYFIGKICTIFTQPVNRGFKEDVARQHFVIRVGEITDESVWGCRLDERAAVWFPMHEVISIQEEQELDPTNPEHKALIQRFEETSGKKFKGDVEFGAPKAEATPPKALDLPILGQKKPEPVDQGQGDSVFVDIEALEALARKSQRAYKTLAELND